MCKDPLALGGGIITENTELRITESELFPCFVLRASCFVSGSKAPLFSHISYISLSLLWS